MMFFTKAKVKIDILAGRWDIVGLHWMRWISIVGGRDHDKYRVFSRVQKARRMLTSTWAKTFINDATNV
jgi:hypothetical protein